MENSSRFLGRSTRCDDCNNRDLSFMNCYARFGKKQVWSTVRPIATIRNLSRSTWSSHGWIERLKKLRIAIWYTSAGFVCSSSNFGYVFKLDGAEGNIKKSWNWKAWLSSRKPAVMLTNNESSSIAHHIELSVHSILLEKFERSSGGPADDTSLRYSSSSARSQHQF